MKVKKSTKILLLGAGGLLVAAGSGAIGASTTTDLDGNNRVLSGSDVFKAFSNDLISQFSFGHDNLITTVDATRTPRNPGAGPDTNGNSTDGTYYTGATKQGACRGHQGVKDWYGDAAAPAAAKPAAAPAPVAAAAPAQAPAVVSAPAAAPAAARAAAPTVAAPGGGNGQVWVNKNTKVYHCPGDRWYGKTKEGAYLSESDARAQGYKADHNKACT